MFYYSRVIFLFLVTITLYSQSINSISALRNVSISHVYSSSVEDSFYVYTKLPESYFNSTKSYPILYVLDGDLIFPIACGATEYLEGGEYVPEMIIVGIGYGTMDWQKGNQRSRDFTPIASDGRPFEGGGENFLKFLTKELIPKINKEFRIDKSNQILMGHSLGGQFVIYTMLTSPQSFTKYIASSPHIFRILEYYDDLLNKNSEKVNDYNKKIFISVGENESKEEYINPITNFVDRLKKRLNYKTNIEYKILPEGEHFLNSPTALMFGLKWVFEQ